MWHLHHKWFIISFAHCEERKTMKHHSERCSTVIKFSEWVSWHNYTTSNCTHATIKVKNFAIFRMVEAAKLKKMLRAITNLDLNVNVFVEIRPFFIYWNISIFIHFCFVPFCMLKFHFGYCALFVYQKLFQHSKYMATNKQFNNVGNSEMIKQLN